MSEWRHAICDSCWRKLEPEREPYRLTQAEVERCCWCGAATLSGIYIRQDPQSLDCKGEHE